MGKQITTDFDVTGMSCSACQAAVERAVQKCGVDDVSVNLLSARMKVTYDDEKVTPATIMAAVEDAGYHAATHNAANINAELSKEEESKRMRIRYSVILLIPLMLVAMLPMAHIDALHDFFHSTFWLLVSPLAQFILAMIILVINRAYFTNGFRSLIQRHPNMDSLVATGSGISLIYSLYTTGVIYVATFAGDTGVAASGLHNLYYDSAAMIVSLITIGKYLEARAKRHTSDAISDLMALAPETAYRVQGDQVVPIQTSEVVLGDILEVRPGGRVPVDGEIVSGASSIDESAFSGESIPVEKGIGDMVSAGTINTTGAFRFRATAIGADTALSQIVALVENANATKAPIARAADKVAAIFVPTILSIALITFLVWLFVIGEPFTFAIRMGISVIVISCPCALGLATPVAIMVGSGRGAKKGILFKDATALERMHQVDTIVFDKTGTVTEGHPSLTDIVPLHDENTEDLLRLTASLEAMSEHPLAQAITNAAAEKGLELTEVTEFQSIGGRGIEATIDGRTYYAGNIRLLNDMNIDTANAEEIAIRLAKEGKTPLYLADKEHILGILACADKIKEDTPMGIRVLHQMGKKLIMLTGDHKATAEAVASQIGVDEVISEVLPAQKEQVVADLMSQGKVVAMVGDGVNDAPALARADIGIAIGAGTDIAIESGDVILTSSQISDIAYADELSGATIRNIHQNLFWAFFYNALCIPLAAGVFYYSLHITLNPMIAAACMSMSSLFVVTNALRLRTWKPKFAPEHEESAVVVPEVDLSQAKYTATVGIDGMSCNHCKMSVEKGLGALNGILSVEVSLEDKNAAIRATVDPSTLPIEATLKDLGFTFTGINVETNAVATPPYTGTVRIDGMSCNHCKMSVEKNLGALEGMLSVEVNLDEKNASIAASVDPATLPIEATLKDIGFTFVGLESQCNIPAESAPAVPQTPYTAIVHVEGMSCNHCKMSVEKNLGKLDGVAAVEVSLEDKIATVQATVDPGTLPIEATLKDIGFTFAGIETTFNAPAPAEDTPACAVAQAPYSAVIRIDGMSCNHCKMSVEKALNGLDGITSAEVNLDEKNASITATVDPATLPIEATLTDIGFTFVGIDSQCNAPAADADSQTIIVKIDGMSCNHCKMSVEKGLGALEGITGVEVNLDEKKAVVVTTVDPTTLPIEETLKNLGFTFVGMERLCGCPITKPAAEDTYQAIVKIDGMSCNHCKMSVEKGLGALEGITAVEVSLDDKNAAITATVDPTTLPIEETLKNLGFTFVGIESQK